VGPGTRTVLRRADAADTRHFSGSSPPGVRPSTSPASEGPTVRAAPCSFLIAEASRVSCGTR
ncbi:MAG: hypothetical protein ACRDRS_26275, partial [Pseudonocardiaceae bacterium]